MSHRLSVRQPRIMLALSTFAAFFILVASAADIADFDDEKYGFEYIYHDETDLMITIHDNKCYYTAVTEDSEHYLSSDRHLLFFSSRDLTEKFLRDQIRLNHNETIVPSSLDAMRDQYEDLLADFRCEGREIFHVVFNRTASHPSQSHGSNNLHPDGSSRYPWTGRR